MKNPHMNMNQKLVAFLMTTPPSQLPDNPNAQSHYDLGLKVKSLIDEGRIVIKGLDQNGALQIHERGRS